MPGTSLELPLLGVGTVAWGRNWGLKYPATAGAAHPALPSDAELDRLLGLAEGVGANLLDTAPAYGTREERLGRLLAGRRHRFVLSTKVGEASTPAGSTYDFRPQAIRSSLERSLRRLCTDVVDIVLLHSSGDDDEALDGLGTLVALRDEGKIRVVGASTKTLDGGRRLMEALADDAALLMIEHSPTNRSQEGLLDHARGRAGVLIKKPLASGHWALDHPPAEALRFVARHPAVTSIVVGTTSPEHLRANAAALEAMTASS